MKIDVFTLPTGDTAAQWITPAGTEMQVVGLGDAGVLFGARRPGDTWNMVTLADPYRFGDWKTRKSMRAWVDAFLADAMKED